MKMAALNRRDSRLAAIGLLLLALLLAYFVLLHWWFVAPLLRVHGEMADLRDTHSRYAAVIAEKPALEKRIAALGAGQAASSAFLAADDPNTAAADLMQRAPRWFAKGGAEGLLCAADGDHLGVVLKSADGSSRPLEPALAAFLAPLGVDLADLAVTSIRNSRNEPVGEAISSA